MKRITLALAVAGALLVPALLTGSAGAANPHGDKGDPNASCGNGNRPCDDPNLPQSEGCLHGQAPVQNPHCQPGGSGLGPSTPPASAPPAGNNPSGGGGGNAGAGNSGDKPARGVAGAEAGNQASGNPGTATAVSSAKTIEELPFTGLETLWLALVGGGLLALGLILRVRSSSPREDPAETFDPPVSGGNEGNWHVPELGMTPAHKRPSVDLPFSEFEALGRLLIGNGQARLRAGPGGALVVNLDTG